MGFKLILNNSTIQWYVFYLYKSYQGNVYNI